MAVKLIRASVEQAELIWRMQVEAFRKTYEVYRDTETSPATEPMEKVLARLQQPETWYYLIEWDGRLAGAIRVVDRRQPGEAKRISPIFVLEQFRNHGIAQSAIREAERLHGSHNWTLSTMLEETGNCHLYEKMGYRRTGKTERINDRLTLVFYQKD